MTYTSENAELRINLNANALRVLSSGFFELDLLDGRYGYHDAFPSCLLFRSLWGRRSNSMHVGLKSEGKRKETCAFFGLYLRLCSRLQQLDLAESRPSVYPL